jgi:hypothetical protein
MIAGEMVRFVERRTQMIDRSMVANRWYIMICPSHVKVAACVTEIADKLLFRSRDARAACLATGRKLPIRRVVDQSARHMRGFGHSALCDCLWWRGYGESSLSRIHLWPASCLHGVGATIGGHGVRQLCHSNAAMR